MVSDRKFIALSMAPEVVVIVQNQDTSLGIFALILTRRSKTTQPRADNDKVLMTADLACLGRAVTAQGDVVHCFK